MKTSISTQFKASLGIGKLSVLSGLTLASLIPALSQAAIFGADNRVSATQNSVYAQMAKATAVAVLSANVSVNPNGRLDLSVDNQKDLCKDEKFAGDPSLSFSCSGFLIAPDLLVTAGHCVYAVNTPNQELKNEKALACSTFSWLFDYRPNVSGKTDTKNLAPSRLYKCKEIIYGVHKESTAPYSDYALIRLDRPVTDRLPFKINTAPLPKSSILSAIGYPLGTPAKVSTDARIRLDQPSRESFITTLDVFEGNSGGPVVNSANEVVGILVGGTPTANTFLSKRGQCERMNRCTEDAKKCFDVDSPEAMAKFRQRGFQAIGSEVQRIAPIVKLVESLK